MEGPGFTTSWSSVYFIFFTLETTNRPHSLFNFAETKPDFTIFDLHFESYVRRVSAVLGMCGILEDQAWMGSLRALDREMSRYVDWFRELRSAFS